MAAEATGPWRALRNAPGQGVSVPPVILTYTLIARNLERP